MTVSTFCPHLKLSYFGFEDYICRVMYVTASFVVTFTGYVKK